MAAPKSIDEYVSQFPAEVQVRLSRIRQTIAKAAPDATEAMKYQIPTSVLNENLVHFAGFAKHIGFYPTPSGMEQFRDEFAAYKCGKGSVQFPLDKPLPLSLVQRVVQFRVREAKAKAKTK